MFSIILFDQYFVLGIICVTGSICTCLFPIFSAFKSANHSPISIRFSAISIPVKTNNVITIASRFPEYHNWKNINPALTEEVSLKYAMKYGMALYLRKSVPMIHCIMPNVNNKATRP